MKKTIIVLIAIVVLVSAYMVAFPKNNPVKKIFAKTPGAGSDKNTVPVGASEAGFKGNAQIIPGFPLKRGDRGSVISELQIALNAGFDSGLVVDGIFGPLTYTAISKAGFNADGLSYDAYSEILNAA